MHISRYGLKSNYDEDWIGDSFATRDAAILAAKRITCRVRIYDTHTVPYRLVALKRDDGEWYWPTGNKCKHCADGHHCRVCDSTGNAFDRKVRYG